jgi:plasmid stabilization system protein ParE
MRRVVWSPRALRELEEHLDWVGRDDPERSAIARRDIDAWVERVAEHLFGTMDQRSGLKTCGRREINKRLYYRVFHDRIEIATFWDMRRDRRAIRLPSSSS